MMLKWIDVLKLANNGNLASDRRVEKTDEEWKAILTPEQFQVTRLKGTERPHTNGCELFQAGRYACICCDTELFDSEEKFESGTGWPSFTQPVKNNVVSYHKDTSLGMIRVETTCSTCDAHLGHVFQDGPPPSGLRFCINSVAMKKVERKDATITLGGGCFWCTEAIFKSLEGVKEIKSGYSGGKIANPTYREVTSGLTGHAEVIQITYDTDKISFEDIVRVHLTTHDPTTIDQQGADVGSQYRSVIFYRTAVEQQQALEVIKEVQDAYDDMIVTEVVMFESFYEASEEHQNYYEQNTDRAYCQAVINPKLKKLKELYADKIKPEEITT